MPRWIGRTLSQPKSDPVSDFDQPVTRSSRNIQEDVESHDGSSGDHDSNSADKFDLAGGQEPPGECLSQPKTSIILSSSPYGFQRHQGLLEYESPQPHIRDGRASASSSSNMGDYYSSSPWVPDEDDASSSQADEHAPQTELGASVDCSSSEIEGSRGPAPFDDRPSDTASSETNDDLDTGDDGDADQAMPDHAGRSIEMPRGLASSHQDLSTDKGPSLLPHRRTVIRLHKALSGSNKASWPPHMDEPGDVQMSGALNSPENLGQKRKRPRSEDSHSKETMSPSNSDTESRQPKKRAISPSSLMNTEAKINVFAPLKLKFPPLSFFQGLPRRDQQYVPPPQPSGQPRRRRKYDSRRPMFMAPSSPTDALRRSRRRRQLPPLREQPHESPLGEEEDQVHVPDEGPRQDKDHVRGWPSFKNVTLRDKTAQPGEKLVVGTDDLIEE